MRFRKIQTYRQGKEEQWRRESTGKRKKSLGNLRKRFRNRNPKLGRDIRFLVLKRRNKKEKRTKIFKKNLRSY